MTPLISFKDFLTESRSAPLYHASPVGNLTLILKHGLVAETYHAIFKGFNQASAGRYGVSLTRNMRNADWYMKNQYLDSEYVVFELDQQAIQNRYKIVPIDYFATQDLLAYPRGSGRTNLHRAEAEEFVIVPKKWDPETSDYRIPRIPPQFIKAVHYFSKISPDYSEIVERAKAKFPQMKWVERRS